MRYGDRRRVGIPRWPAGFHRTPVTTPGSPTVKKGRHRRFEEARKLKQAGPGAFDLGFGERSTRADGVDDDDDDDYAALAEKYGVTFDDDDDSED